MKWSPANTSGKFMCILRITFPISRLMGLAPYSNDLDYSGFWAAYSLIFCSLIFITVVIVNYNYISTGEERHDEWILNPYNLKLYLAQIHLQGFALGMHLFKITIRDKEFAQVLKFIKETFVGPITISIIFSSGSSTILGLCWLFECYMSWPIVDPPDPTTMWTFFTAMYGDMVCFVIVMQFCATISVLKFGFAHITYVLKRTRFKYVRKLILRHSSLIHRTKYVNQFYSKQLVAIITLTALNYVSWAFFGLQDFMRSSPQLILGLSKLQQAFYQLYLLLCLCRCCDATIIEADAFCKELFRLTWKSKYLHTDYDSINLYLSMRPSVSFPASGFFNIGFPLITSIVTAASTYLVIIIQFSTSKI